MWCRDLDRQQLHWPLRLTLSSISVPSGNWELFCNLCKMVVCPEALYRLRMWLWFCPGKFNCVVPVIGARGGEFMCQPRVDLWIHWIWDLGKACRLLCCRPWERFYKCHTHIRTYSCSVATSCLTLCRAMPGLSVLHHLLEFAQVHVHWVGDAIQPSPPLSSPSPRVFNLSQHQGLLQWASSLHRVAKVLSQLFHAPLSPSSRGSLAPLCFLPLQWYRLCVWGCWYFSWQSWLRLVAHPARRCMRCALHLS